MTARPATRPAPAAPPAGAWLRLSAALTGQVPPIAGRKDLVVTCAPGAGHGSPACFFPAHAAIEVDGTHLGVAPATANPASPADRERYPVTWGALIHECAHAAHTRWTPPPAETAAWAEAARMLEESRIETAQTTRRPADRRWLRETITQLILADFTAAGATPASPREAGCAAALILARADAGILDPAEAAPVEQAVTTVLGAKRLDGLRAIWRAAHATADTDARTMLRLGRRWCRILGIQPDPPPPPSTGGAPGHGAGAPVAGRLGRGQDHRRDQGRRRRREHPRPRRPTRQGHPAGRREHRPRQRPARRPGRLRRPLPVRPARPGRPGHRRHPRTHRGRKGCRPPPRPRAAQRHHRAARRRHHHLAHPARPAEDAPGHGRRRAARRRRPAHRRAVQPHHPPPRPRPPTQGRDRVRRVRLHDALHRARRLRRLDPRPRHHHDPRRDRRRRHLRRHRPGCHLARPRPRPGDHLHRHRLLRGLPQRHRRPRRRPRACPAPAPPGCWSSSPTASTKTPSTPTGRPASPAWPPPGAASSGSPPTSPATSP